MQADLYNSHKMVVVVVIFVFKQTAYFVMHLWSMIIPLLRQDRLCFQQ